MQNVGVTKFIKRFCMKVSTGAVFGGRCWLLTFNSQFSKKKLSEKKNDNVQKTAKATPSTTLALYMTLIHTM
jgi:hypothetical protein